jgi:multiple sugar transport system substrate-binding protein
MSIQNQEEDSHMRRIGTILLSLVALTALTASTFAAPKKVTLSYYYWQENQKPILEQTIAAFNKVNPDITIETSLLPWAQYWTKLQTSLPSGAGPDVYWMNAPHAVEYIPAGLALDLTSRIKADKVDMSMYPDGIKNLYTKDGKVYALPKDYDSIGLLYNKELFDKAGVKYPDSTWTWNTLLDAAKKLTNASIGQYGFCVDVGAQTGLGNFIFQNGGAYYSAGNTKAAINSAQNRETLQFMVDMIFSSKVSPTIEQSTETPSYSLFQGGKVAMITFGDWYVGTLQETLGSAIGVAPLPQKKTRASILHGLGFAVDARTKTPDEAWKFVKFSASRDAMALQASVVIPAYKGMETQWIAKFPGLDMKIFTDASAYGIPLPVAARNSTNVDTALYNALDKILKQKVSVADGLAQAEKDMNAELAK